MPDWFHNDEISKALAEFTRTAQQAQVTLAAAERIVRNFEETRIKIDALVDDLHTTFRRLVNAGKP